MGIISCLFCWIYCILMDKSTYCILKYQGRGFVADWNGNQTCFFCPCSRWIHLALPGVDSSSYVASSVMSAKLILARKNAVLCWRAVAWETEERAELLDQQPVFKWSLVNSKTIGFLQERCTWLNDKTYWKLVLKKLELINYMVAWLNGSSNDKVNGHVCSKIE